MTHPLELHGVHGPALEVCARMGVTLADVMSRSQMRTTAAARFQIMRLLRDRGLSLPEIGRVLGRDHTTVLAGLRKIGGADRAARHDVLDRKILWLDRAREAARAI